VGGGGGGGGGGAGGGGVGGAPRGGGGGGKVSVSKVGASVCSAFFGVFFVCDGWGGAGHTLR